jgi:hypothetical protein
MGEGKAEHPTFNIEHPTSKCSIEERVDPSRGPLSTPRPRGPGDRARPIAANPHFPPKKRVRHVSITDSIFHCMDAMGHFLHAMGHFLHAMEHFLHVIEHFMPATEHLIHAMGRLMHGTTGPMR